MKRKFKVILLCVLMVLVLILAGCSKEKTDLTNSNGKEEYDLTLYSIQTTNPNFSIWLDEAENATGLNINVVAAPTDADTRQQKITTVLSSGDNTIDILEINDEMAASFKNTGWLEPLQNVVISDEILNQLPQGYVADMITSSEGDIIGVPGYSGYLAFWVNQQILDELGFENIETKEDFIAFAQAASGNGRYGYGGSWEKTYVFNEIGTFVNLFGGDYFDWTNPNSREAVKFMYDMVNTWDVTPIDQIADRYEQMNQKFIDGKYAMIFMWGSGTDYKNAGMLGDDKIHIALMPKFNTRSVFSDSWSYVLNKSSNNKESSLKFLSYMASEAGMISSWNNFDRYPARKDAAMQVSDDNPIKKIYKEYADNCIVRGRPMLPQTMEFISEIGTLFQSYVQDKISLDEFCESAQKSVETYM